jgi:type III secretion protein V
VGKDIGSQILAQPRALLIGAVVATGMGAIPGMPFAIFATLAVVIAIVGLVLLKATRRVVDAKTGKVSEISALQPADPTSGKPAESDEASTFLPTVPLIVDVAADLQNSFSSDVLNEELMKIRRALYADLGVPFPGISLRFSSSIPKERYHILLSEVPVAVGQLRPDHVLVRDSHQNLAMLQVPFERDAGFLPGIPTLWVASTLQQSLNDAGMVTMDANQILTYHLAAVLKKYSSEFIGIQETRFLIDAMESRFPDLVKEALRIMPIQKIAEILQRLVSEDVSVRNLRSILEALVEWGQKEKDTVLLTEYMRISQKRHISYKFSSGRNVLPAYLLAPAIEDTMRAAIRQTSAGSYLALDPSISKALLAAIKNVVGELTPSAHRPVLLTSMDIRRYLRKLIETDLYELPVLSYQELTPEINVQPLDRVVL